MVTVIKGNCEYSYSKEISSEQLVERQGVIYHPNHTFTGTVTHSQYFGLTSQRINYKEGKIRWCMGGISQRYTRRSPTKKIKLEKW